MAYDYGTLARTTRPRRRMRLVLVLAAAALFVCCVGATGLGAWNFQSVRGAQGPARQAADDFLKAVTAGDLPGAYDRLCAATRQWMSPESFGRWVRSQPKITQYAILDVRVTSDDGGLKGTVSTELTWQSGVVAPRELPMRTDSGQWRVCGDPF